MKKRLLISILILCFLAGCGQTENQSSISEQVQTTNPEDEVICELPGYEFFSIQEFKASEQYNEIKKRGYVPYILEYDEERYTLDNIISYDFEYTYNFTDNINGEPIEYLIQHNGVPTDVFELAEKSTYDRKYAETVEFNGITYDIFIHATEYDGTLNHGVGYYPYDNCCIHMWAGLNATKEEAIECFGDFTLVPDTIE